METHVLLFILEINICSDYLYNNYATHDTELIQDNRPSVFFIISILLE